MRVDLTRKIIDLIQKGVEVDTTDGRIDVVQGDGFVLQVERTNVNRFHVVKIRLLIENGSYLDYQRVILGLTVMPHLSGGAVSSRIRNYEGQMWYGWVYTREGRILPKIKLKCHRKFDNEEEESFESPIRGSIRF